MISHRHLSIFVHIQKCAGTSIERALGHFDGFEGRGGQDHRTVRQLQQPPPLSALTTFDNVKEVARRVRYSLRTHANLNNDATVTRDQWRQHFMFAFVRNPYTRTYSA